VIYVGVSLLSRMTVVPPALRWMCISAVSPLITARLVRFWAALLGEDPVDRADGVVARRTARISALVVPTGSETKVTKNRLHLERCWRDCSRARPLVTTAKPRQVD
jgi:hypothetical protein